MRFIRTWIEVKSVDDVTVIRDSVELAKDNEGWDEMNDQPGENLDEVDSEDIVREWLIQWVKIKMDCKWMITWSQKN